MTDILKQLSRASWRGIEFPVSAREFGFSHQQAKHRYIFRDDELIESLGRENPTYRFTIPFREDIARGPWANLFTLVYPKFLDACLDRTRGIMNDPVHGEKRVKCATLREVLDVNRRDGIDVEVEFIVAPTEASVLAGIDSTAGLSTIEGARNVKGALDREPKPLDPAVAAELAELNKPSERGRLSPLDFATSVVNQSQAAGNKISAALGDVAFRAQRLSDAVRDSRDPKNQPIRANARRLELAARDLAVSPIGGSKRKQRLIGVHTVAQPIGRIALAAKLGMSLQELMDLNPGIARSITVRTGTQVAYYRT